GVSALQRNLQPPPDADGTRYRPPLPLDLHYLVTAWGKSAPRQQRLLGWCMRMLEDLGKFNSSLLNRYGGPDIVFKPAETVDLFYEPITMTDLSSLWDLLKPNAQVSVGYVARMIYIDSKIEMPTGAPVQTRAFDAGREENAE